MKSKRPFQNRDLRIHSAIQAALAIMLIGVAWLMWDARHQTSHFSSLKPIATNPRISPLAVERINRHMQLTEKKGELRSLAMEMENHDLAPQLLESNLVPRSIHREPVNNPFESENTAAHVYRDTDSSSDRYDNPYLPEERVTAMIEQEKWLERYNQRQIEAFIDNLRKNALAEGYVLEINDQLQVTRVRKVRDPSSIQAYRPSGSR